MSCPCLSSVCNGFYSNFNSLSHIKNNPTAAVTEESKGVFVSGCEHVFSPLTLDIVIWESMGTDPLLETASSGHSGNCSFIGAVVEFGKLFLSPGVNSVMHSGSLQIKCFSLNIMNHST